MSWLRFQNRQADQGIEAAIWQLKKISRRRKNSTFLIRKSVGPRQLLPEVDSFTLARLILQNVTSLEKEAEKFVCEGFATGQALVPVDISRRCQFTCWVIRKCWTLNHFTSQDESLDEKQVFQIYYGFQRQLLTCRVYHLLASITWEKLNCLESVWTCDRRIRFLRCPVQDWKMLYRWSCSTVSWKKGLASTIERRIRAGINWKLEEGAINTFSDNLRNLPSWLLPERARGSKLTLLFVQVPSWLLLTQQGKCWRPQVIYPVKPASARQIEAKERFSRPDRSIQW